jgi:rhomboid protease GluP
VVSDKLEKTYNSKRINFNIAGLFIIVNIIFYALLAFQSRNILLINNRLLSIFGQFNLAVFKGWYWQLFTSLFVHANLLHLLGNMFFLGIFGLKAEDLFGKSRFILLYFTTGLAGNILTLLMGPYVVSVGASGAIFGLFGANASFMRSRINQSIAGALIYALYLFLLNIGANVNILAHFGGLAVGLIIGYIWGKLESSRERIQEKID